jgi:hypothetical protein
VKRLTLLLSLFALLALPAQAQAHKYLRVNTTTAFYEQRMQARINIYRAEHGEFPLFADTFNLHLAGVALSWANYREARWTTSIGGVPWPVWNDDFLTPTQQVYNWMITSIRCHGLPWTPRQVLHSLRQSFLYRSQLLSPAVWQIGVRVVYVHRHVGWFYGKGRCTAYYIAGAS